MHPVLLDRLLKMMREAGLDPPQGSDGVGRFVPDRKVYFSSGTKGRRDSSALLEYSDFGDTIRGYFINYLDGNSDSRFHTFYLSVKDDEKDGEAGRGKGADPVRMERERELRELREKVRAESAQSAREKALKLCEAGVRADSNPYLAKKGVLPLHPESYLIEVDSEVARQIIGYRPRRGPDVLSGKLLVAPLFDTKGNLVNVELIDPTSIKVGLHGGPRSGVFWNTLPLRDGEPVGLAEGVATAMSLTAAMGFPVVAVGGCGNFRTTLAALRESLPRSALIVFADRGKGADAARRAAQEHGVALLEPPGDLDGTDFNDLHARRGLDALRDHVREGLPETVVDPNALGGIDPGRRRIDFGRITAIPEMDFVLPGLRAGNVGMLVGMGSVGKSYLALQVGMAIAAGRPIPWLSDEGEFIPRVGRVGLIFGEDDDDIIVSRSFHVMESARDFWRDEEIIARLRRNLYTYGLVGQDLRVSVQDRYSVSPGPFLPHLESFCEGKRIVFVDPLARIMDGDENNNLLAGAAMTQLARIGYRTRCAIVLLHHVSKGGAGEREEWTASRGASALTTSVRWQANLRPVTEDEYGMLRLPEPFKDARLNHLALVATKVNYGRRPGTSFLSRGEGGVLQPIRPSGAHLPPPRSPAQGSAAIPWESKGRKPKPFDPDDD